MKQLKFILLVIFVCAFSAAGQTETVAGSSGQAEESRSAVPASEIEALVRLGRYDDAEELARETLEKAESAHGAKHIETGRALMDLGYVLHSKNDREKAAEAFEDSYKIYEDEENLTDSENYFVAKMLTTLAEIYARENLLKSKKSYEAALRWFEKYGDANSFETVNALTSVAKIEYWQRDFKNSAKLYLEALEKIGKNGNFDRERWAIILDDAECSFRKAGKPEEFENLRESLAPEKISEKTKEPENPEKIEKGTVNGKALSLPRPYYPEEARVKRARGTVKVRVHIDGTGTVVSACAVNKKDLSLMFAAELAAYRARFEPTLLGGKPVRVSGVIEYKFSR